MKKIILTGGGTAGHVTPNLALLPKLLEEGYKVYYIGSKNGMEKELVEAAKVTYSGISSGKLRRYFDPKNITDIFQVVKGIHEARSIIGKLKPDVIFSKGGFVAVPVVIAGRWMGTPVIIHESDITCGLANKLSMPFANIVCCSFPETLKTIKNGKGILTGTPIRERLFHGNAEKGLKICSFDNTRPMLLVMGGSLGSVKINDIVRKALPKLLKSYQIAHICGKGHADSSLSLKGYAQFEYISEDLPHLFAAASLVVSRAGANSIMEFLALKKPSLLIPLPKTASRGDQILNAESFLRQGFSKVLAEEELGEERLITEIIDLYTNRDKYIAKMRESASNDGVDAIMKLINILIFRTN